jgi:hypothetical protein
MRDQFLSIYRLRLSFRAIDSLFFPPYKSGNILRGAFGILFRQIACAGDCAGPKICPFREQCSYARVFEPEATSLTPSGFKDPPRPFCFRTLAIDGKTIGPGREFAFDVHIFDTRAATVAAFIATFAQVARQGLGPRRGRASLEIAELRSLDGDAMRPLWKLGQATNEMLPPPEQIDFHSPCKGPHAIRVHFLTPTELKGGEQVLTRPEFPILIARARDRVSTLRAMYGDGPLALDFKLLELQARSVIATKIAVSQIEAERQSSRTGLRHPLGGFVGLAEYEGDLQPFLPLLRAAQYTGIGRQTVWGKGATRVEIIAP